MGQDRDRQGRVNHMASALFPRTEQVLKFDQPYVIAEGPHWFALYKPPCWEVRISSQNEDDFSFGIEEDSTAEEYTCQSSHDEERRKDKSKPNVQVWMQ